MNGDALLSEVAYILRDPAMDQYEKPRLVTALNEAYAALCKLKPDAFTVCENITLDAGTEQSVPADAHALIEVIANVDSASGRELRAVTKAERGAFDAAYPQWRQDKPRNHVRQWFNDELKESKFFVWPPAPAARGDEPVVPAVPVDPAQGGAAVAPGGLFTMKLSDATHPNDSYIPVLPLNHAGPPDLSGVVDLIMVDPDPGWDNEIYISLHLEAAGVPTDNGDALEIRENGVALTWPDARFADGRIFRVENTGFGYFNLIGIDIYSIGPTQAEIDAYQAELVIYNAAVTAHAAWLAAGEALSVRVSLAKVPTLFDGAAAPVVPDEPTAPVDPGALGDGGTALTLLNGYIDNIGFVTGSGLILRHTDGSAEGDLITFFPIGDGKEAIVFLDRIEAAAVAALTHSPNRIFVAGGGVTNPNWGTSQLRGDGETTAMSPSDPRLVAGQYLRLAPAAGATYVSDFDYQYSAGVTQVEIDAYQAAFAQYQTDQTVYDAAVLALAAFNGTQTNAQFTLGDELPVDAIYFPFLREWMLYRTYCVDDEMSPNYARAANHFRQAFSLLGMRAQGQMAIKKVQEQVE